jgi:hypothetical protein
MGAKPAQNSNLEKAAAAENENLTGSVKAMQSDFAKQAESMLQQWFGAVAVAMLPR